VTQPLYALRRGNQWVAAPAKRSHRPVPRYNGQPTFLPGLTLATDRDRAWTTDDLEVAHRRRDLLRIVPPGWATAIERLP
jgi:hypothetical protein